MLMAEPESRSERTRTENTARTIGSYVVFCTLAAIGYGIVHDLLSTQVCLEYFTKYHPPVFPTQNPLLLALAWGVYATFWMGAILGLLLGGVAVYGRAPALPVRQIRKPLVLGLACLLAFAILSWLVIYGIGGYAIHLAQTQGKKPPTELDRRLVSSAVAHMVSYSGSVVLAVLLSAWVVWQRRRMLPSSEPARSDAS